MTDNPITALFASRSNEPRNVPGGREGTCSMCDEAVWLAPSSIKLIEAKPEIRIVCLPCSTRFLAECDKRGGAEFRAVPGSEQEILDAAEWYAEGSRE